MNETGHRSAYKAVNLAVIDDGHADLMPELDRVARASRSEYSSAFHRLMVRAAYIRAFGAEFPIVPEYPTLEVDDKIWVLPMMRNRFGWVGTINAEVVDHVIDEHIWIYPVFGLTDYDYVVDMAGFSGPMLRDFDTVTDPDPLTMAEFGSYRCRYVEARDPREDYPTLVFRTELDVFAVIGGMGDE